MFNKTKKNNSFICSTCGENHDELPALSYPTPVYYSYLKEADKKKIAVISKDFCEIKYHDQTDRFIRTTMTFEVKDACEDLDYGIWVSVSKSTFEEFKAPFDIKNEGKVYFGRICNNIPEYKESTLGIHVNIQATDDGLVPEIIPHKSEHALVKDWENGITIAQAEQRIKNMMND